MKVLFVNRYFYPDHSATSQMLSDLCFWLAARGHEVKVITSRQRYDDPRAKLEASAAIDGVDIVRVWSPTFGRSNLLGRTLDYLGFYLTSTIAMWRHADSRTVVIAKTDPPLISVPAAWVCKFRRAHLVNWLQDLFPEVAGALRVIDEKSLAYRFTRRLRDWSLKAASANVVIGEQMAGRIATPGIARGRIRNINNWADDESIQPIPPERNPLRAQWGLEGKFVVGYSGNLGRAHDGDAILHAAKALRQLSDIHFLVIGGGVGFTAFEAAAKQQGLANIAFKPYQPRERLSQSLSAADVHIVSLRPELEGFVVPSKIYGILAADRPVIFLGDANGEIGTMVTQHRLGSVCDKSDGHRLDNIILQMHAIDANAHSRPRQALEENWSKRRSMKEWEMVLTEAMADSAQARGTTPC